MPEADGGITDAVSVTGWPKGAGSGPPDRRTVVGVAWARTLNGTTSRAEATGKNRENMFTGFQAD